MRYSIHELAVLNDRRVAHECGQEGTTHFYKLLTALSLFIKKNVVNIVLYRC